MEDLALPGITSDVGYLLFRRHSHYFQDCCIDQIVDTIEVSGRRVTRCLLDLLCLYKIFPKEILVPFSEQNLSTLVLSPSLNRNRSDLSRCHGSELRQEESGILILIDPNLDTFSSGDLPLEHDGRSRTKRTVYSDPERGQFVFVRVFSSRSLVR